MNSAPFLLKASPNNISYSGLRSCLSLPQPHTSVPPSHSALAIFVSVLLVRLASPSPPPPTCSGTFFPHIHRRLPHLPLRSRANVTSLGKLTSALHCSSCMCSSLSFSVTSLMCPALTPQGCQPSLPASRLSAPDQKLDLVHRVYSKKNLLNE